jgi:hypothetical protein
MPPVDENGVRDFTVKRPPHRFRIDDDVFAAPAVISPVALKRLAALHSQMGDRMGSLSDASEMTPERFDQILKLIEDMFKILLPGDSGERFASRMRDENAPLDVVGQLIPIIYWLLEQYGLRPTLPSSDSPTGSTEAGTDTQSDGGSSMDGASPTETESI